MNTLKYLLTLSLSLALTASAWAHGGDEHKEHAHAAPATVLETTASVPTMRVESDQFEVVARLYDDELGLYIDRWASNAPVLNAEVEVEVNGHKAVAKFHADHGDYAVTDAALIESLHVEGEHALVFTIVAGEELDLLNGTLHVQAESPVVAIKKHWRLLSVGLGFGLILVIGCGLAVHHLRRAQKEGKA